MGTQVMGIKSPVFSPRSARYPPSLAPNQYGFDVIF